MKLKKCAALLLVSSCLLTGCTTSSAKKVDSKYVVASLEKGNKTKNIFADNLYKDIIEPSSKLKACMDIIETAKENNQKILLFSSFTKSLDLIEAELRKKDISYYVLTGSTTKIKRHQLVNAFQNDQTTVFLISLKAGGTGLNLTSASTVIVFKPINTPA